MRARRGLQGGRSKKQQRRDSAMLLGWRRWSKLDKELSKKGAAEPRQGLTVLQGQRS